MNLICTALLLSVLGSDGSGSAGFPLLKIGQGPRASAMGESFTGLADDATAVYWNPAGLGLSRRLEFELSHQEWFADINDELVHAALPLGPGALGLGLVYTGEPDVRYWDDDGQSWNTFRAWNTILSVGYGLPVFRHYRVGASITGLYQSLLDESGAGGTVSVGALGEPMPGLGLGIAARHLGVMGVAGAVEKLPLEIGTGASYRYGDFRMTLDAVFALLDNAPNVRFGVEYTPIDLLALRLGYRTGPYDINTLGIVNGFTGGLGIKLGGFGLDYAFVPYGELGMTHRVGLKASLLPAAPKPPKPPPPPPPPPPEPEPEPEPVPEPEPLPVTGTQRIIVLDLDTREPVPATLTASGIIDTFAQAELALTAIPGPVSLKAEMAGYEPKTADYNIVPGLDRTDTIFLRRYVPAIRVRLFDAQTKLPIAGTVKYAGPATGTLTVPDGPDGALVRDIATGTYTLDAAGPTPDYLPQLADVEVALEQTTERTFYLWRKTEPIILRGINFETGKADILPQFYPILDSAGEILRQSTAWKKVELAGHTDPRNIRTREFPSNVELSQARAEAVMKYLIAKWGIAPDRLTARGYAATVPLVPNTSPENMYKNRRTELRVIE